MGSVTPPPENDLATCLIGQVFLFKNARMALGLVIFEKMPVQFVFKHYLYKYRMNIFAARGHYISLKIFYSLTDKLIKTHLVIL